MCTRYVLLEQHYRDILARLGIAAPADYASRYNIAPNTAIPIVRRARLSTKNESALLRWGLVPSWAKSADGPPLVNARADTVTKFAVSTYVSNVRHEGPGCLAPASADQAAADSGPQLSLGF